MDIQLSPICFLQEMKAFLVTTDVINASPKNSVGGQMKDRQMKDNNFETLFAIIDEYCSGGLDCAEFSAFMGHII